MEKISGTTKLLELINEFSKIAGYKIGIQKSIDFCTLALKNMKMKLRNQFHHIASKRIKCLAINLTKEVQDFYSGNYKALLKKS